VGTVLLIVGGFLVGGAYSVWSQSKDSSDKRKSRQAKGFATALAVCALLALAGGVLRLV
jgi:uncharacterized membrane protein YidH (DUF202 family)